MIIVGILARPEVEPRTPLGKRLREVRSATGIEDRDVFAERTGVSKSTIANYERGDRTPDAAMLERYRDSWNVDLNWLVTGEGEMFTSVGQVLARRMVTGMSAPTEVISTSVPSIGDEFVRLPVFNEVQAAAGQGFVPPSEQATGVMAFARRFLRELGAAPDRCTIIRATGDSMQPSIPDGSLLVVDHGQTEVKNGHIMVINLGDDLLVKRIRRRLDGLVDLISDNQAYPPETIGSDMLQQLRVVGRVVYFCRTP